jgi:adenine-specific DNA-methyltransferase
MPDPKRFENQFFEALRDIFVGAKVEGDSGFINLMRIKSRYYTQGVFPLLHKDINAALKPFPDFREELFDKLFTFFQRYFSESGSIYFRYTSLHQNIYEKVYTDDRDVILFWKTHMLYYVKTDRIFTSLNVEVDEVKFFFDASKIKLKKANEKRLTVYAFRKAEADGTLVFDVSYSEKGRSTKVDDILRAIKQAGQKVSDETLAQACRVFEKQSEVDYFINKDARAFLQEQFDLWLYQYLFAGQNVWNAERLAQLQALKTIALKVIDFISQFEDELVRIWNKPKFVRNSHYIVTLDKITEPKILKKLFAHANMAAQLDEWRGLGMIDDQFSLALLKEKDVVGEPRHPHYRFLPLDTKFFPDLELDILALLDDLDAALDGWLVHSENYQALRTLLPKHNRSIKCIYIDPPYNTGTDGFIYRDKYFQASWLSMLENRLSLASEFLDEKGVALISIDDYEVADLRLLTNSIFGTDSFVCNFVWRRRISSSLARQLVSSDHEYVLTVSPNRRDIDILGEERDMSKFDQKDDKGKSFASMPLSVGMTKNQRPNQWYELINPKTKTSYWPPDGRVWCYYPPTMENKIKEGKILWPEDFPNHKLNVPRIKLYPEDIKKSKKPTSTWINEKSESIKNLDGEKNILSSGRNEEGTRNLKDLIGEFEDQIYPKPVSLIEGLCRQFSFEDDLILDFFSGSGTTAHAVMNMNRTDGGHRKYIIIEMAEYFNTIIVPRIKKVAFNSKWRDGKPVFEKGESGMSQFVKYYDLEQYEDVLRRTRYADADLFDNPYEDPYHQYIFLRDLKNLDALEVDAGANTLHFHPERLYDNIDLAETLSNLRGKWIKHITKDHVEFQDGERISLTDPDWRILKPLVWW